MRHGDDNDTNPEAMTLRSVSDSVNSGPILALVDDGTCCASSKSSRRRPWCMDDARLQYGILCAKSTQRRVRRLRINQSRQSR
jgi:hypothetical protein